MFGKKKRITETVRNLRTMQNDNIHDDYSCGVYNGLELALAVIENREPVFATCDKEPINITHNEEQEKPVGRTIASGIIRG